MCYLPGKDTEPFLVHAHSSHIKAKYIVVTSLLLHLSHLMLIVFIY